MQVSVRTWLISAFVLQATGTTAIVGYFLALISNQRILADLPPSVSTEIIHPIQHYPAIYFNPYSAICGIGLIILGLVSFAIGLGLGTHHALPQSTQSSQVFNTEQSPAVSKTLLQHEESRYQQVAAALEQQVQEKTAALRQSQANLELITDSIPGGIAYIDADQRYRFANYTYKRWFNHDNSEMVDETVQQVLGEQVYETAKTDIARVLAGERVSGERYLKFADGSERHVLATLVPNLDEQERVLGYYVLLTDISDRKRAETELMQAKEAAEAAARAKSIFIANMSHELRSPLNAILGFAQVLQQDLHRDTDQWTQIETIRQNGEYLLAIINQILDLSRLEANRIRLNPTVVKLEELLKDIQTLFLLRAKTQGLSFSLNRESKLPDAVFTDDTKLRQVLINLLDNAVKFTQQGNITLTVSSYPLTTVTAPHLSPVDLSGQAADVCIQFGVSDTGAGIASEEQPLLFEPFSQTTTGKARTGGTGLGLAISKEFVQLMGGNISVVSQPGQGSTFQFDIQAPSLTVAAPENPAQPRKVIGLAPGQPHHRMLIVDDSPVNRLLLKRVLSVLKVETREAENGEDAINQWEAWRPQVIWMDLSMPRVDGYTATQHIRTQEKVAENNQAELSHAKALIIAVSATDTPEQLTAAFSAGCDDFISKPLKVNQIFEILQRYLALRYCYEEDAR